MVDFMVNVLKTIRPRQWLKNLSVAAALVFSGNLFEPDKVQIIFWAIVLMTLLTSAIYLFNDIIDRESDRQHPFKRLRPIAAGKLAIPSAITLVFIFTYVSLWGAWRLSPFFFAALFAYLVLQLSYSIYLKHVPIIEILTIAAGFILRVYAGALVIDAHLSIWFLLCVVTTALLISIGKRRAELAILTEQAAKHRQVLSRYLPEVLNSYVIMFATSTWLSWALFTFFEPTLPIVRTFPELFAGLPLTFSGTNKWLMVTIPVVIYGVMRYLRIIYDGSKAESPERVLLSDKPLLSAVVIWGVMVVGILYLLPARP